MKKSELRQIIREEILAEMKPKVGHEFEHEGITWVVVKPGSSQSRVKALTKNIPAARFRRSGVEIARDGTAVLDNEVIHGR